MIMIEMRSENDSSQRGLLDQESRNKLPKLYANEEQGMEAKALIKFFTPDSNWTWYASEFDGEDTFFGLVAGFEVELGYFSLSELEQKKGPLGLEIERDLFFKAKTLRELSELHDSDYLPNQGTLAQEARCRLFDKLELFSGQIAKWDKRIIEITTQGDLVNIDVASKIVIPLICTFAPEPRNDSEGYFSIANLIGRTQYEKAEERLGLTHLIDLGFKLNGKMYLPNGKALEIPEEQIILWPQNEKKYAG